MLENNKENTELYIKFIETNDYKYFQKIHDNVYPYSYNMVRKYLKKKYFTKDIINDVFEKLIIKKNQFDTRKMFNNWYLVILFNEINNTNKTDRIHCVYFDRYDDDDYNPSKRDYNTELKEHIAFESDDHYDDPSDIEYFNQWVITFIKDNLIDKFLSFIPEEFHEVMFRRYCDGIKPRHLVEEEGYDDEFFAKLRYRLHHDSSHMRDLYKNMQKEISFVENELNIYWKD